MKETVSVLLCVKNVEKHIAKCIGSILNQSFASFEVVIVDDQSTDKTRDIIKSFNDRRIKYFKNENWLGISKSRNRSLKLSEGDYVFFTDGDCVVSKDWLAQGLEVLNKFDCAGVEGMSYYVSEGYLPTFSDHTYPRGRGKFMTGNIAYRRKAIENVGSFDERYNYFEDRDLALRILRHAKIEFNPNMIVYIQKEIETPKSIIKHSPIIKNRIYLFKRFHDKELISWRIIDLMAFEKVICPPMVIATLFLNKFSTSDDYKLVPFRYVKAIQERIELWKECARERVFLI